MVISNSEHTHLFEITTIPPEILTNQSHVIIDAMTATEEELLRTEIRLKAEQKAAEINKAADEIAADWFENLNVDEIEQTTGLTVKDLITIFAQTPKERHAKLVELVSSLPGMRDIFLRHPENKDFFKYYWKRLLTLLYPNQSEEAINKMTVYLDEIGHGQAEWVKNAEFIGPEDKRKRVMFQLYADLYTVDVDGKTWGFHELISKLDELQKLGITDIWVLPPFESPMMDAGFDISDRRLIRNALGGNDAFIAFVQAAADRGITVMVDMVLNHASYKSEEFQIAINPDHPEHIEKRSMFHFEDGDEEPDRHSNMHVIFEDMVVGEEGIDVFPTAAGKAKKSNWTKVRHTDGTMSWVLTRFMAQMPDWNFGNPEVLIKEMQHMQFWLDTVQKGVNFRYDAIKHLWKLDVKDIDPELLEKYPALVDIIHEYRSDNLPQNHLVMYLFNAFVKHRYSTVDGKQLVELIAEVWDRPENEIRYNGKRGEGAGSYDFDLMFRLIMMYFKGDASELHEAIKNGKMYNPQKFMVGMIRHHDAIARGDSSDGSHVADKATMLKYLSYTPEQIAAFQKVYPDFTGEEGVMFEGGVAARLRTFLRALEDTDDPQVEVEVIQRAMMTLFFTAFTPMIYMGDHKGEVNSIDHLIKMSIGPNGEQLGIDVRHASRSIRPDVVTNQLLSDSTTVEAMTFAMTQRVIELRKTIPALSEGEIVPLTVLSSATVDGAFAPTTKVFAAVKQVQTHLNECVVMVSNLHKTQEPISIELRSNVTESAQLEFTDLMSGEKVVATTERRNGKLFMNYVLQPRETRWLVLEG